VPNLRHDPDAAVVVTEVWQLFVSEGSAAFGAVDTAFGAWHGGHSRCGALRKWRVEVRIRPYNSAPFIDFDSCLLQVPNYLQDSNDTQDVA